MIFLGSYVLSKNYALLISTSAYFTNYRHMANIMALRKLLLNNNFDAQNIHLFAPDNQIENDRYLLKSEILLDENMRIQYTNAKDMNLKIIKLTEFVLMDILLLRMKQFQEIDENDNLMIYLCGHAREGFFKTCSKYFLFKDDIEAAMNYLSKRVANCLIILDTCQAESLVGEIPGNVALVTTSMEGEFSFSSRTSEILGIYSIDDFMYELYTNAEEMLTREMTLIRLADMMNYRIKSKVKLHGSREYKANDFFTRNDTPREIKKFVL